ncbi:hypothetical protein ABFS82_08G090800 [Erythranthe guttata]|uniref:Polyadenylate-binding protein 1-B-binding protein n=1 Tax=Erythranthe guttata TaxID=4155 RepID=A0A022Q810_ERYGU|nr:PREDICTED: uncharacterized protein LOC105973143 [Erythranthe guttata]EYU23744.1 hypothetical protein MIMGU_mgv1a019112mg [Erythranthe guttata]|eukprot:XP_012853617.1 PREDICTED: uncharacterized protein LOC105973143 [Erythranthe guttata]
MNREEEEIQFLGFFGIIQESYDIVSSWKIIFTKITLFLILPLSFIYLAHIQISELLFSKIMLDETPQRTGSHKKISDVLCSEWTAFFLFKIGYFIFFVILSLLSTSAVVYTVACIYTAKRITLKKVMTVVPKVCKRLVVTFVWSFIIFSAYNVVSILVLLILGPVSFSGPLFLTLYAVSYLIGFFYITVIWHLASVVSVLEESYGLNAMARSHALIKGKMGVCFALFFVMGLFFIEIQLIFKVYVVVGTNEEGIGRRVGIGILCLVLSSITMLFGLIMQTIIYFVCKSYHHENIDKSSLADHLGGYLGEYVPLKSKDVQLEHFQV